VGGDPCVAILRAAGFCGSISIVAEIIWRSAASCVRVHRSLREAQGRLFVGSAWLRQALRCLRMTPTWN